MVIPSGWWMLPIDPVPGGKVTPDNIELVEVTNYEPY